ncbi:MAG: phosphotransferase, partial [Roseibium sp.]|nr:phosphotransferase [Roseibium sp.]
REMLVGYLQHRKLLLGRTHGDLAPGNILFTSTGDEPEDYALSGLIDWDNSQDDGPGQYDLYHLLLATRVLRSGEDLGPVVRDVLKNGWSDDERRLLGEAATEEGEFTQSAQRPLILLTWINHLAANLNKSERYAKNRFWIAANLDWVLIALKRDRLLSI